jgi:hypothetical protein
MLGLFTIGSSLGNMLAGLGNGLLLDLNGAAGFAGWQWVFIGTGVPAVLLTFVVLLYLPSSPQSARFLDEPARQLLAAAHARRPSPASAVSNPWAAIWDLTVVGFGAIYMLYATAFYDVTYWLATIIQAFGVSATVNGLLNMIPWALGAIIALTIPRLLRDDRTIFSTAGLRNSPRCQLLRHEHPAHRQHAPLHRTGNRRPMPRAAQSVLLDIPAAILLRRSRNSQCRGGKFNRQSWGLPRSEPRTWVARKRAASTGQCLCHHFA